MATKGFEFAYMLDGSNATPVIRDMAVNGTGAFAVGDLTVADSAGQLGRVTSTTGEVTAVIQEARTSGSDGDYLRAAIDAARTHVSTAAGGAVAAQKSPLACRHLSMLARYRNPLPASETIRLHLVLLEAAWQAIDAALASLSEIRFGGALGVDIQKWYSNPSSSPWLVTS